MSKIILEPLKVSRGKGLHNPTIKRGTVLARFKKDNFFYREDTQEVVGKYEFKPGTKVFLRFGPGLVNLVSYIVKKEDLPICQGE